MLIIAGTFRIPTDTRDAILKAACEMQAETQKEPGCHAYRFTKDLEDSSLMHLFERWESEEHLRAHFATPHMALFQKALGGLRPEIVEIQKYEISKVGPVR
jgi:quinol monooxygenase YgiN